MQNQVDKKIKDIRATKLRALVVEKYNEFVNKNINTIQEVIFERRNKPEDGVYKGLTRNYLTVYAKNDFDMRNQIYNCKIKKIAANKIFTELL